MNYILALVGPSGSGKTSLMLECIKALPGKAGILKSTTTRSKRPGEDDRTYRFITPEQARQSIDRGEAATVSFYADNYYIYEKSEIQKTLTKHHGFCAVVEKVVLQMVESGYPLKVIKIIPEKQTVFREGEARRADDIERSKIKIPVDLEIVNSFEPGGFEKALQQLIDFVSTL